MYCQVSIADVGQAVERIHSETFVIREHLYPRIHCMSPVYSLKYAWFTSLIVTYYISFKRNQFSKVDLSFHLVHFTLRTVMHPKDANEICCIVV